MIESATPFSWMGLGCGTFAEVPAYFSLTPEQWAYLKAGEPVLLPGDTVEVAVEKGRERVRGVGGEPEGAARRAGAADEGSTGV